MAQDAPAPAQGSDPVEALVSFLTAEDEGAPPPRKPAPGQGAAAEAADAEAEERSEGEEASEGEEQRPEEPEVPRYRVKVAGKEEEVTLDELLSGYQRDGDYRQKTQALATERRVFEEQRQSFGTQAQEWTQLLQTYEQQLAAALRMDAASAPTAPPHPSQFSDPDEYQLKLGEFVTYQHNLGEKQRLLAQIQAEQDRLQAQAWEARMPIERQKLLERFPEWRDSERFTREFQAVGHAVVNDYGFTPEEWNRAMFDHRNVAIAEDARRYREATRRAAAAKKKVAPLPPRIARPSGAAAPADGIQESRVKAARQRLSKTGRVEDAVPSIEAMLSQERTRR